MNGGWQDDLTAVILALVVTYTVLYVVTTIIGSL